MWLVEVPQLIIIMVLLQMIRSMLMDNDILGSDNYGSNEVKYLQQ